MAKKKKEHIAFDRVCKVKPSLPFAKTNRLTVRKGKCEITKDGHSKG